eukprot:3267205-Pyramimonas_sp.AAC.1
MPSWGRCLGGRLGGPSRGCRLGGAVLGVPSWAVIWGPSKQQKSEALLPNGWRSVSAAPDVHRYGGQYCAALGVQVGL